MKKLLVIVLLILAISPVQGDEELAPYTYVTAAPGGRYYFKMYTIQGRDYDRNIGRGELYAVRNPGPDKILWRTSGWYAFQVFLSFDGAYLVRLGNWPRGHKPSHKHLGVAFYKNGKLLKSYSTKDLIEDMKQVRPSVSHYQYLDESIPPGLVEDYGYLFRLKSVDGIVYVFDMKTGKVKSRD